MAYSGIFRTIDIFSQFLACYSGITQEQFQHILNLIQADSGIFRTLTNLGTSCFTYIQPYSRSYILGYTYRGTFARIQAYFGGFRFFSLLFQKQTFRILLFSQYFNNNNYNNNNISSTLVRHSHTPRQHTIQVTCHQRQQRQPCQHTSRASTLHTLAHHPRKYATHATHASTLPTQSMLARVAKVYYSRKPSCSKF